LGILLSAAFWLPTVEFARQSNRAGALEWTDAIRGSLPPEEAFEFVLPRLLGDSMPAGRGAYAGRYGESPTSAPERVVSDYAGMGTIFFALMALILARRRRAALAWGGLAALGLAISIGGYWGAPYRWALAWLPGLSHFRSPSTAMALTAYALANAAALGAQGWRREWILAPRRAMRAGLAASIPIAALLGLIPVLLMGLSEAPNPKLPLDFPALQSMLTGVALRGFGWLLATIALAALAGAILAARKGRNLSFGVAALAWLPLAALWAGDLAVNARPFWNARAAAPFERYIESHWAMRAWDEHRAEGPIREIQLGRELNNWAMTWTDYGRGRVVSALHGYHPVAYGDYFRLLEATGFTHPNFLRLFGAGWLLVPDGWSEPLPARFEKVAGVAGESLYFDPSARYIRPVRALRVVADDDAVLKQLADPAHDPDAVTLMTAGDLGGDPPVPASAMQLHYRVVNPVPGEVVIHYTADRAGPIAIAEPWPARWRVEGRAVPEGDWLPTATARADGYFLMLREIPAGSGVVRLTYDPLSQRVGNGISLAGLALALGWMLVRIGRNVRRAGAKASA
jgi:hypothetical protein